MKAFIAVLASVLGCTVTQAQRVDLEFLGLGKTYVIRFASDQQHFKGESVRKIDAPKGLQQSGGQFFQRTKIELEVFKVVQLSSGSWIQMEYPADPADYGKWNEKLKAQATLTDANIAELEKTAEGKTALKSFRESSDRVIATKQSWINLDHAIEISDVPSEMTYSLEIETSEVPSKLPFGLELDSSTDKPEEKVKSYPSPDASESRLPTTGVEEATEEEPTAATTPKASTDRLAAELEELKAERHPLLMKQQIDAHANARSLLRAFDKGQGDLKELLKAYDELLEMRLESASTPSLRISAFLQHVIALTKVESKLKAVEKSDSERRQLGQSSESEEYRTVTLARLNAKIALIEEKQRSSNLKLINDGTNTFHRITNTINYDE